MDTLTCNRLETARHVRYRLPEYTGIGGQFFELRAVEQDDGSIHVECLQADFTRDGDLNSLLGTTWDWTFDDADMETAIESARDAVVEQLTELERDRNSS